VPKKSEIPAKTTKKASTVKPNFVTKTQTAVPCVYQQNITSKNNKKILLKRADSGILISMPKNPNQKTV